MRISDFNPSLNPRQVSGNPRADSARSIDSFEGTATDEALSGGADIVQISGISQLLKADAAHRANHIANLTQLVRSGRYDLPAGDLSRAIVQETLARSGADR